MKHLNDQYVKLLRENFNCTSSEIQHILSLKKIRIEILSNATYDEAILMKAHYLKRSESINEINSNAIFNLIQDLSKIGAKIIDQCKGYITVITEIEYLSIIFEMDHIFMIHLLDRLPVQSVETEEQQARREEFIFEVKVLSYLIFENNKNVFNKCTNTILLVKAKSSEEAVEKTKNYYGDLEEIFLDNNYELYKKNIEIIDIVKRLELETIIFNKEVIEAYHSIINKNLPYQFKNKWIDAWINKKNKSKGYDRFFQ